MHVLSAVSYEDGEAEAGYAMFAESKLPMRLVDTEGRRGVVARHQAPQIACKHRHR